MSRAGVRGRAFEALRANLLLIEEVVDLEEEVGGRKEALAELPGTNREPGRQPTPAMVLLAMALLRLLLATHSAPQLPASSLWTGGVLMALLPMCPEHQCPSHGAERR